MKTNLLLVSLSDARVIYWEVRRYNRTSMWRGCKVLHNSSSNVGVDIVGGVVWVGISNRGWCCHIL